MLGGVFYDRTSAWFNYFATFPCYDFIANGALR